MNKLLRVVTVYPRWRGEHIFGAFFITGARGLSPLARGTLAQWLIRQYPHRFIPAGAGNTAFWFPQYLFHSVYPRWRGEHGSCTPSPAVRGGLSPLARGTLTNRVATVEDGRFIPAGAGNTDTRKLTIDEPPVYPRWRGEHWVL